VSKQEEIREDAIIITKDQLWAEGIRNEQRLAVRAIQIVDGILHRLKDKGCVLKVDRELPVHDYLHWHRGEWCFTPKMFAKFIDDKAGYVAVEPLIEV